MKHRRTRVARWTMARTFTVRAIRAWRGLLPDWTPSLDQMAALEHQPHEYRLAISVLSEDWEAEDPRWDVLLALLEYERREQRARDTRDYWSEPGRVDEWLGQVVETQKLEVADATGMDTDDTQVHGAVVGGPEEGEVRDLRDVHPQAEDVHPDGEPVQQEPADGTPEDSPGDPDGTAGNGLVVVQRAPAVFSVRTLASIRAEQAGGDG